MDILDTVGKRIRASRKSLRLDQRALAAATGVHEKTVSRWENDVGLPDSDVLPRLAERLQVSIGWLLSGEPPPRASPAAVAPKDGALAQTSEQAVERVLRSHRVRIWLADFRAELTRLRASDQEIATALAVAKSPSVLLFFGRPDDHGVISDEHAIRGLELLATAIRASLKQRA